MIIYAQSKIVPREDALVWRSKPRQKQQSAASVDDASSLTHGRFNT